jgi:hypothetical protein
MRTILRRVRAALSLAALWGAISGAIGLAIGLATGVQRSRYPVLPDVGQWWFEWHDVVIGFATSWAAGGALIAVGFAAVLRRAERGRDAETLSPARLALWGALAGGGIFSVWWLAATQLRGRGLGAAGFPLLSLCTAIAFGAGCAWLTLRLARRADPDAPSAGLAGGSRAAHDVLPPGELPEVRNRADARVEVT